MITRATAAAAAAGVSFEVARRERSYSVEEAAAKLGVATDALVKTLVVRRSAGEYLLVCLSGSRSLDWAKLRTLVGERRLSLPEAAEALTATGYERGTITPFGAEPTWPVFVDVAVMAHDTIAIGGGAHGVSILLAPGDLVAAVGARVADVSRAGDG